SVSCSPLVDLGTPAGRGFLAMFMAMAERERERIIKRTHEGRRIPQQRGIKNGPQAEAHRAPAPAGRKAPGRRRRDDKGDCARLGLEQGAKPKKNAKTEAKSTTCELR